jgi:hypothetical protein
MRNREVLQNEEVNVAKNGRIDGFHYATKSIEFAHLLKFVACQMILREIK